MRKLYFLLLFLGAVQTATAQKNGSVSGKLMDTAINKPIAGATITVLDKKDSSLVSFTMTGNDGSFEIKGLAEGAYRLLITHINYHNSNKLFTISATDKNASLGTVAMNDLTKTMAEVEVTAEAPPVTLLNDTIQYNAGSFKVQPNANVEQLLKKLPGVKVEKDGSIKAQGEKVAKVLVDGKEFFGSDPKVATKNLPADAIDKVQVYDKQSDQAQLTGFEDGNYEKTINLKLKKDKKKGMFGKVNAGGGTKERYEGKFNVNSFKGARQFSAIGMGNNTNAEGFSFMDILNFTGELSRMQNNGGGNININMSGEQAAGMGMNGGSSNSGINTAWAGGLNYNNIIGTRADLQSNYFYNRFNPKSESHIQRQNFLPDSFYYYNEDAFTNNLNKSHRLNANLLYQLDTFNSIRIVPSFNYQQTDNRLQRNYQTLSASGQMTNDGFSNSRTTNGGYNFRNDILWRRKFARRGRTFSLSLQTTLNASDGDGSLSSINSFYNPDGTLRKIDTLNQQSETEAALRGYTAKAVYTEPLFKRSLLEASISRSYSKSVAEKITQDYNKQSGKYDLVNKTLSNNFENIYAYTNAGLRFRTQKRKYNYALGLAFQQADLKGKIISGTTDSVLKKTFTNLLPTARLQYNFTKFKSFSVNYIASTNQPSISQLQPVPDNSNPLNIKEGNPDLKQEYNHTVMGNLNLVSPFKNRNLFFFFNAQFTKNKITNYDTLNQLLGIKRSRPVNVNGVYNISGQASYSRPVRFLKGTIELSSFVRQARTKQFINGVGNDISTFTLGPGIRLDMNPTSKLNVTVGTEINRNRSTYSLQSALNNTYLSQEYNASVDWELPKRFFFSTDFAYIINSQRSAGFNYKVPLWNASISKQMLKYNRGELKLSARDLLNKNIGINRTSNSNYIEDSRVLTLRRFFSLSFTYSLNKVGLNNGGGGGNMRIITR
ncbi:MAG: TonB-dependent receptor family protein [Ferruginibacter sp.]|nr:TonB-dependent receptor family protein [Ferruginibacter sp.]